MAGRRDRTDENEEWTETNGEWTEKNEEGEGVQGPRGEHRGGGGLPVGWQAAKGGLAGGRTALAVVGR